MALTNRLGVVNWTLGNDNITLSASLLNQKRMEEATGMGFFQFVAAMEAFDEDAHGNLIPRRNPLTTMAELFHFLQVGTDYSAEDIFACFFADISAYEEMEGGFQALQTKLINHMMGNKESAIIAEAQKTEEKKAKS